MGRAPEFFINVLILRRCLSEKPTLMRRGDGISPAANVGGSVERLRTLVLTVSHPCRGRRNESTVRSRRREERSVIVESFQFESVPPADRDGYSPSDENDCGKQSYEIIGWFIIEKICNGVCDCVHKAILQDNDSQTGVEPIGSELFHVGSTYCLAKPVEFSNYSGYACIPAARRSLYARASSANGIKRLDLNRSRGIRRLTQKCEPYWVCRQQKVNGNPALFNAGE
jgi:hypothetical protein